MTRVISDYLEDIVTAIRDINGFVQGMNFEQFAADRKTVNAVTRSLEIIGEAARSIPSEVQQRYPSIPWSEMIGMRNKLIHAYFGVNVSVLWETVTKDLPQILIPLKQMLAEVKTSEKVEP